MSISIEREYAVWDDKEGVHMRPDADGLGMLRIQTGNDKASKEWFGEIDFTLQPEFAVHLAKAILAYAEDLKTTTN